LQASTLIFASSSFIRGLNAGHVSGKITIESSNASALLRARTLDSLSPFLDGGGRIAATSNA
jgi:hypothetical protein